MEFYENQIVSNYNDTVTYFVNNYHKTRKQIANANWYLKQKYGISLQDSKELGSMYWLQSMFGGI